MHWRQAGVVVAIVDLDDIQQFYRAIDLGSGSAINPLREDGTLVVREPAVADAVEKKYPRSAGGGRSRKSASDTIRTRRLPS
jgi:hypothetical protein